MTSSIAAGVDWAGDGWFAVFFDGPAFDEYVFEPTFEALWDEHRLPEPVLVDVPIGLPEDPESLAAREELDSLARTVTGRSSSVFPVPSREAARKAYEENASFEDVAAQNESDIEKGLSKQSFYITEGIGEVDAFLCGDNDAKQSVIESHPEVCFRALLGRPLEHGKTSAPGVGERLEALETPLENPGETLTEITVALQGESAAIDLDDVLDAVVLGVTASKGKEELEYLRPNERSQDSADLPFQMAYWAEEPLTE